MIRERGHLWFCLECERWINRIVNGDTCPFCGSRACQGVLA